MRSMAAEAFGECQLPWKSMLKRLNEFYVEGKRFKLSRSAFNPSVKPQLEDVETSAEFRAKVLKTLYFCLTFSGAFKSQLSARLTQIPILA